MALVNTLRKKVDLPVWEWCRPTPITTAAGGSLTTSDTGTHQYLYYLGATFWRYDTISDSWAQLTTPPVAITTAARINYSNYRGYYGRVISSIDSSKIRIAGLVGNALQGYKIRIISGRGQGQERTITNVDDMIVWDRGLVTAVTTTTPLSLTDSTKNWKFNQWRDYQVRIVLGTGIATRQIFKIAYNSNNTIFVADGNYQGLESYTGVFYRAWTTNPATTAGSQTIFQIESSDITVDTPWDIPPDNTSRFLVLSGGIWYMTGGTNFQMMYYDVLADAWYTCTSQGATGIGPSAALATDIDIEKIGEWAGAFFTGSATSGSTRTLQDTSLNLTGSQWVNYRLRITSGSGMGESRCIVSSSVNTFTVAPPFDYQPTSESKYSIYGDVNKVYWIGHGQSQIYKYHTDFDMHVLSQIYDYGCPSQLCFTWDGMTNSAMPITTLNRSGTTAQVTTSFNHCMSASNMIHVYGATDPLYNITASITSVPTLTGFTYTMTGTPGSNAVSAVPALSTINLSDPSKNWIPNEHSGSICVYQSATIGTATPVFRSTKIISNTSQSLQLMTASASPIVLGKYAICSPVAMGHATSGSTDSTSGTCTSNGATTTLIDGTKNWFTNQWAGYRVKIVAGTNHGIETPIASNTSTTLTVTAMTSASDTSSMYTILGCPIRGIANKLFWVANASSGSNDLIKGRYLFCFPGGATSQLNRYDISTETWDIVDMVTFGVETLTTGTSYAYDGADYIYFQINVTGRVYRLNVNTLRVEPSSTIPFGHGAALLGNRMEIIETEDGLKYLYHQRNTGQEMWRTLVYW